VAGLYNSDQFFTKLLSLNNGFFTPQFSLDLFTDNTKTVSFRHKKTAIKAVFTVIQL